jgi:hypothetical protein
MMLVSLHRAKQHLRIDQDVEDDFIVFYIQAASALVLNYLRDGQDAFLDSSSYDSNDDLLTDDDGEPIGIPYEVQAASLLMVGYLYKNRDNNEDGAFEQGYLPKPVTALLYPLRDPVCQ